MKQDIVAFWKDTLICKFRINNYCNINYFKTQAENLILNGIRNLNRPIKEQIQVYIHFCNIVLKKKKTDKHINDKDKLLFMCCLFALVRLKIIELDDNVSTFGYKQKLKSKLI